MSRRGSIEANYRPYAEILKKQYEAFADALKLAKVKSPLQYLDHLNSILVKELDSNWEKTGEVDYGATHDDREAYIKEILKELKQKGGFAWSALIPLISILPQILGQGAKGACKKGGLSWAEYVKKHPGIVSKLNTGGASKKGGFNWASLIPLIPALLPLITGKGLLPLDPFLKEKFKAFPYKGFPGIYKPAPSPWINWTKGGKSKKASKKGLSPWNKHLKAYMAKHKGMSLKEAMKEASASYK